MSSGNPERRPAGAKPARSGARPPGPVVSLAAFLATCRWFGAVPGRVVLDNTSLVVKKILRGPSARRRAPSRPGARPSHCTQTSARRARTWRRARWSAESRSSSARILRFGFSQEATRGIAWPCGAQAWAAFLGGVVARGWSKSRLRGLGEPSRARRSRMKKNGARRRDPAGPVPRTSAGSGHPCVADPTGEDRGGLGDRLHAADPGALDDLLAAALE